MPLCMSHVLVLGAGESGVGAALLARQLGEIVWVSDSKSIADVHKSELIAAGIPYEENGHSPVTLEGAAICIKSPGIPNQAAVVQSLIAKGVPVISEIEYGSRYSHAKLIAITGSNGKTTTTMLTAHLLDCYGKENTRFASKMGGNIGTSFARQVADDLKLGKHPDWYVLEVSSFQLDNIDTFHANIAVLTNITPDHLDRYEYVFQNYVDSKFRIIKNQQVDDVFITIRDGGVVEGELSKYQNPATLYTISTEPHNREIMPGGWLTEDFVHVQFFPKDGGCLTQIDLPKKSLPIQGDHNYLNIQAAVLAAVRVGIPHGKILDYLQSFRNAPHRLESVGTIKEVEYVNDSKATNVDSVRYALGSFPGKKIVWIAGGIDKGNDYHLLADLVAAHVKDLIILGPHKENLEKSFAEKLPLHYAADLDQAIALSQLIAKAGDVVLLSPACASFDLFKNYEDRGNQFRDKVIALSTSL